jgi:hypothetical protein
MRLLGLNLLTSLVTVALLAGLSVPAMRVLRHGSSGDPAAASAEPAAPSTIRVRRTFGVYVDPWHVDDWATTVGARPQVVAKFEAFSRKRTIDAFLRQTERDAISQVLVCWEPWEPVPAKLGRTVESLPQPGYRNADIVRGAQDAYILSFARSLATFRGTVWLRYAHEMNGFWYPWSRGPRSYRRAWRHVVTLVRSAGARNVRFVWSANPNLYESAASWMRKTRGYWPGSQWVDVVGSTMINFGGPKHYVVSRFEPRLRALRRTFGKPVFLAETNTEQRGAVAWLRDLRRMLRRTPWIRSVAWSQLPSRSAAQMPSGRLDWDVRTDPPAAAQIRALVREGRR